MGCMGDVLLLIVGTCDPGLPNALQPTLLGTTTLSEGRRGCPNNLGGGALCGFPGWQADISCKVHPSTLCASVSLNLETDTVFSLRDSTASYFASKKTRPQPRPSGPNELSPEEIHLRVGVTAQRGGPQGIHCTLRKGHISSALRYERGSQSG